MKIIFVYITCKNIEEAILIGKSLVEFKLVGCVNIFEQMTSIYQWEEKMEVAKEVVLIGKTNESLFDEIVSKVKQVHSYTTPCILSIPIQNGNDDYLQWLASGLK
jgi:periplasmic divalent cation tolerance protein